MEKYYSLNSYFKTKYGEKIGKLCLDGGFTCPNRDGTISNSGCVFCTKRGSGEFCGSIVRKDSIKNQIEIQKSLQRKKWNVNKFFAYFQNFTNTYKPVDELKVIYDEALTDADVIGLSIATRADSIKFDVLDLIKSYENNYEVWIELGMQTIHDNTLKFINRGYDHKYFDRVAGQMVSNGFKIITHIIIGLPGETRKDMIETFKYVADLHPFGVKIHSLYADKYSELADIYEKENFKLLTKEEYINIVCDGLSILPKDIVIHRLTGDGDKNSLIAPKWIMNKISVIGGINKELKKRECK